MGSECLVLRTPAPAWGTARGPPPPTPTQTVAGPTGLPQRMVRSATPTEAALRLLLRFPTPASDPRRKTLPDPLLPNLLVLGTVVFSAAPWHSLRRSLGPG